MKLGLRPRRRCSLSAELADLVRICKENQISELRALVFNAAIWFIWRERNDRIFNKAFTYKTKLFDQLELEIQMRLKRSTEFSPRGEEHATVLQNWNCSPRFKECRSAFCSWTALAFDGIKINSDGFLLSTRAGYGARIRDSQAEVLPILHLSCDTKPIHLIELRGALLGLQKAAVFSTWKNKIWLEMDSTLSVD